MNWFIPAFVRSSPDSGGGINEDERTRTCSRPSKNERNSSRIRLPSTSGSLPAGQAAPGPGTSCLARSSRSRSSAARLPSSTDSATSRERSSSPLRASRAIAVGFARRTCRRVQREAMIAPAAPKPTPRATQDGRRTFAPVLLLGLLGGLGEALAHPGTQGDQLHD